MTQHLVLALLMASGKHRPVRGIAFHLCSCSAPCLCMFSNGDDMAGCNLVAIYHFTDGGYIGKNINGLTMVVVSRPKELQDRDTAAKKKSPLGIVVYLPQGATESQQRNLKFALEEHQSRFVWSNMEFRSVPIKFGAIKGGYRVAIPKILSASTIAIPGEGKKPMTVQNVSFQEGSTWTLGKTTANSYKDPTEKAWNWDYAKKNGAWCTFKWDWIYHP